MIHKKKTKGPSTMYCKERGFHERGVYPTQDTSRLGTRVKHKEEEDSKIISKEY